MTAGDEDRDIIVKVAFGHFGQFQRLPELQMIFPLALLYDSPTL